MSTETYNMLAEGYEIPPVTTSRTDVSKTYWGSLEVGQDGTYYISWAEAYSVPEVGTLFDESEV